MKARNIFEAREWFEVLETTGQSQSAVMSLAAGQASGEEPEAHVGSDQVLLVVTGTVVGQIAEDEMTLQEGDVVHISAGTMHRFENRTSQPAVTFSVYAPPEYPIGTKG